MTLLANDPAPTGTYAAGRVIHDADAHVMEPVGFFEAYADPDMRERLAPLAGGLALGPTATRSAPPTRPGGTPTPRSCCCTRTTTPSARGTATTASTVLDRLGFNSQLIFTSLYLNALTTLDRGDDEELSLGATRAHNRAIIDFCSADPRLLSTCWVPLASIERAIEIGREALDAGADALMLPSFCPRHHSPTHIGFEPLWAMAQEAGVPIVFHVGGGRPMIPTYKDNGLPAVKDFHGGDGNFTSVSFMAIPEAPMQTVATMIFDGVLERYPDAAHRRHRAGRAVGPGLDALDGRRRRRVHPQRAAPQGPVADAERVRRPPGARRRRTRTRTPAGSSATSAPTSACSAPTTRTSRAAATR